MATTRIVAGDTEPLTGVVRFRGQLVDLTGATLTLLLHEKQQGVIRTGTAVPHADQVTHKGRWTFTGAGGWSATPGIYDMELRIIRPGGVQQTFPNEEQETLIIREPNPFPSVPS